MIITLKGANFANSNIGTLSTWRITTNLGAGATSSNSVTSVDRESNTGYTTTITIAEGYELGAAGITVTMGVTDITSTAVSGLTINIPTKVTGNVVIKVPTKKVGGEEPETPTSYTFTINPDPTSATVTLSATGYSTVSGTGSKSITVANGTKVNWSVSADGYIEQTGSWTISDGNKSENIILAASSESGEPYWVGEKLSGKAHGTGAPSSYLGTQYYYITDEAAISELSGKTVDKMAFNFAVKSGGANTTAGAITVYLVNLSNSVPTNWEAKAEIPVESYPSGSQKEFDITPFVVPAGYTVGYSASKQSILGGGYMMQDYKIGGAYYEKIDDTSSKDAGLGGVDIHIQGM